jgi:uncharacterized protein DUF4321
VPAQRGVALILVIVVAGLVIGSLLGELLGGVLPHGWVHELFTRGPIIGLKEPLGLDLKFLSVTFGFGLKVNVVGVLGIAIAALVLRKV